MTIMESFVALHSTLYCVAALIAGVVLGRRYAAAVFTRDRLLNETARDIAVNDAAEMMLDNRS